MFIGLSLSHCVKDIAKGFVSLDDVFKIFASTKASTPKEIDDLISVYKQYYWNFDPVSCEQIARELFETGRVDQARLSGGEANYIGNGWWIHDGQLIYVDRESSEK